MNLTYELTENGYVILKDGIKWIEQSEYMPYQGETVEKSAQNHVAQLLADEERNEAQVSNTDAIQSLQEETTEIKLALAELAESLLGGV